MGSHMINARSETVADKPAFRHAIKYKRCIVPVSGFYEWSHTGKEKRPHFIHLKGRVPMGLAGIWEQWKSPEGSEIESFAILTTAANKLVAKLHERMPVILPPDTYDLWLNHNMHDTHALENLYAPYPDDLMACYEVSTQVNNPRYDSPDCLAKV
jgi:putative SOS response-associated peptidase YedK